MKLPASKSAALVVAAAALGALAVRAAGPAAAPERVAAAEDMASLRRDATVRAVEEVAPAVVNISTERVIVIRERLFGGSDMLEEFFGDMAPRRRVRQSSLGSGVIIDGDGYVVTNAHVVARATAIDVTLPKPRSRAEWNVRGEVNLGATLVNISPENDIGLLKIEGSGPFPTARLGRSEDALVGETVIALGNPFGLESSVTRGVLSATGRTLEGGPDPRFRDFLQTDAAINPGNSGGPLANLAGEVIGINTAIHSQAQGIGFAIPIARVQTVLADLLDERELAGTFVGIELEPPATAIARVVKGSAADQAGLREKDEIASIDGAPSRTSFDVKRRIVEKKAGDKLHLVVRRPSEAGKTVEVPIDVEVLAAPALPGERVVRQRLGLRVKPITPLLAERLGLDDVGGILVIRADKDGPAVRTGLQAGDIVVRVGVPVDIGRGRIRWSLYETRSLDDLAQLLWRVKPGDHLLVQVLRDGRELRGEIEAR